MIFILQAYSTAVTVVEYVEHELEFELKRDPHTSSSQHAMGCLW